MPVVDLAERIVKDIRQRRLQPGDAYLSTVEAARMLGVNSSSANRALQLVAQRRLLIRRQRKGAVVSSPSDHERDSALARIHLLVRQDYLQTEGLLADGTVIGIQGELPGAEIQFNFMPPFKAEQYVEQVVAGALRSAAPEGFVVVRGSLGVQRVLANSGLPAVVHGTLYPSIKGPAWIDRDHRRAAELLVNHLLDRGAEHLVVLMRDAMLPGDHVTLETIQRVAGARGLSLERVTIRCLPADREAVREEVASLLEATRDRKLGLLCRSRPLADGAAAALEATGLARRSWPPIGVIDLYEPVPERHPYTFIRATLGPQEIGGHIGRMLVQQARGERPIPNHELIPVTLEG